ncbi:MAG TPA: selenide, water dikinase SelD [Hyphomicrobiales bacterium]
MAMISRPVIKDVVLIGAGHAHVQVLRRFGMKPLPGVRFTLITREVHTPYSGMLPGLVAGRYAFDEAHIDTGPLARFAGARLYQSAATGIDLAARRVICDNRPPVPYDILSIDSGSTPNTAAVPGADEHAIPVKPIDRFLARFEALKTRVAERPASHIAMVGAGAAGVELLLSIERRLRREFDPGTLSFTLISGAETILPSFPKSFRRRFEAICAERGIEIVAGHLVEKVERGLLHLAGRGTIEADEILWTTEARPPDWLETTGLPLDDDGFVRVDNHLQAEGVPDVFAAGDIIAFGPRPLPKSGVYAVRAGPVLAENIRRTLTGRSLTPYKPQADAMYLVTNGEDYAIGARNGFSFAGHWVWRWKDWIDRRFMARFNELPEMALQEAAGSYALADKAAIEEISAIPMRCGGCGAKVGASILSRALTGIDPAPREDVLVGLDAPDDAAVIDTGGPLLSVQTVDYFRAIVDDPYLFGKIAANHALGDIFAMGAEPQSALAIATIPYGLEAKVEADLGAMMAGANAMLRAAGCALVGGHTSEGAELALGFSVSGLVARERFLRKGGLTPGDALILAKPLGTGTLLAADMRGKAKARWVMAAIAHMTQSSAAAAKILHTHGATAATDVTGFGLLGHLLEMVSASAADVTVELARLPLLDGVRETIGLGIFSSLHPQNVRLRRAIRNPGEAAAALLYPALFDPQTAGGLLASVPGPRAAACLAALHAAGYGQAAIIGHVEPQSGAAEPITIVVGDSSPRSGIQANGRDEPGPEPRRLSARQPGSPVAP